MELLSQRNADTLGSLKSICSPKTKIVLRSALDSATEV